MSRCNHAALAAPRAAAALPAATRPAALRSRSALAALAVLTLTQALPVRAGAGSVRAPVPYRGLPASLQPMLTPRAPTPAPFEHRLVRGVLAWRDACLAWLRRYPLLGDAAVVALLLWQSGAHVSGIHGGRHVLALALIPAVLLPLMWRRRAPFAVFGVIAALALTQLFVSPELTDDAALLVAFYTIAAYQPTRRVLAAAVILEAGAVLAGARQGTTAGHAFWIWAVTTFLVAATGFVGAYVRTRRAYLASLVDRAQRLEREQERDAQLAAAAERSRIAREMHDVVAHNIAVMIALADGAVYTATDRPGQAVSLMGQVSATGRAALAEMRRLLGVLRDPSTGAVSPGAVSAGSALPGRAAGAVSADGADPPPGLDDVDDLLTAVRTAGLPASLTVTGETFPVPAGMQLALYRMTQEALTNTLKYATGAASVQVHLTYLPGSVGLEVTDDGRPRAETAGLAGQPGGHGITGMRERAAGFGGEVFAGPRPGGGWRVHTVLRLDPELPAASPVPRGAVLADNRLARGRAAAGTESA